MSEQQKHTPGPWYFDSEYIWSVPAKRYVANPQTEDMEKRPWPECEANAHLIAAAPELLDAIKEYMSQFGQALEAHGIPFDPSQSAADAKARAAIAKAEGRDV